MLEASLMAFLSGAIQQYPWLSMALMIMGILRLVVKPLMSIVKQVVAVTPSQKDDLVIAKVEDSKAYKTVCYVLDWFTSVKLPQK